MGLGLGLLSCNIAVLACYLRRIGLGLVYRYNWVNKILSCELCINWDGGWKDRQKGML